MDIAEFKLEDVAVMPVRHLATGQPIKAADGTPVTISVACKDSDHFRRVLRDQTERRVRKAQDSGNQRLTQEEIESEEIDLIAGCTLGWTGLSFNGEAFAFSPENARTLYRDLPWLREQVDKFVAERANFLKASAKA